MNLHYFDAIVINSSAGKDSQTALRYVVLEAQEQGFPLDRITVSHQDLGDIEWPGTIELAREQAEHYGLRFIVTKRRTKDGEEIDLLEGVRRRGMWPDYRNRYCTSDYKRGPGNRVLTRVALELRTQGIKQPKVLQIFGFRTEESKDRADTKFYCQKKLSNGVRRIYRWLPIQKWLEEEVWDDIKRSEVRYHWAYDLGMPRLSCTFCVFAPKGALMIAGKARPQLLDKYIAVERAIGHDFKHGLPLSEIRSAIQQGEDIPACDGTWNM